MDRAAIQTRIDAIDAILARGASSISHNGRTITYDLPAIRRERSFLQSQLNRGSAGKNIRVGRYNTNYAE